MLLRTGSQEKGAGRLACRRLGATTGGGSGGALAHLGGRVAHPEAAAGKGAGVPALQWDLSALVQQGRADFREEG